MAKVFEQFMETLGSASSEKPLKPKEGKLKVPKSIRQEVAANVRHIMKEKRLSPEQEKYQRDVKQLKGEIRELEDQETIVGNEVFSSVIFPLLEKKRLELQATIADEPKGDEENSMMKKQQRVRESMRYVAELENRKADMWLVLAPYIEAPADYYLKEFVEKKMGGKETIGKALVAAYKIKETLPPELVAVLERAEKEVKDAKKAKVVLSDPELKKQVIAAIDAAPVSVEELQPKVAQTRIDGPALIALAVQSGKVKVDDLAEIARVSSRYGSDGESQRRGFLAWKLEGEEGLPALEQKQKKSKLTKQEEGHLHYYKDLQENARKALNENGQGFFNERDLEKLAEKVRAVQAAESRFNEIAIGLNTKIDQAFENQASQYIEKWGKQLVEELAPEFSLVKKRYEEATVAAKDLMENLVKNGKHIDPLSPVTKGVLEKLGHLLPGEKVQSDEKKLASELRELVRRVDSLDYGRIMAEVEQQFNNQLYVIERDLEKLAEQRIGNEALSSKLKKIQAKVKTERAELGKSDRDTHKVRNAVSEKVNAIKSEVNRLTKELETIPQVAKKEIYSAQKEIKSAASSLKNEQERGLRKKQEASSDLQSRIKQLEKDRKELAEKMLVIGRAGKLAKIDGDIEVLKKQLKEIESDMADIHVAMKKCDKLLEV